MNLTHKYVFVCLSKQFPLSQYVVYHYNLYLQHVQTGNILLKNKLLACNLTNNFMEKNISHKYITRIYRTTNKLNTINVYC